MSTNLILGIIFYFIGIPIYYFIVKIDENIVVTYRSMLKKTFDNMWGSLFILSGTFYLIRYCFDICVSDDFTLKNTLCIVLITVLLTESIERHLYIIKSNRSNKKAGGNAQS